MRHTTTDLLHYARTRITDRIAEASDAGASLPLDVLQAYLAFETLDRLESMDCTLLTIMQEITDARGGLHLLAEEARRQYAAGETEEGGFAIEENEG
jgi:hypothetical protein